MSTDSNSLHTSPDILVNPMQNVALSPSAVTDTTSSDTSLSPIRPFISYTQAQILLLYKSPLVSPPPGMPFFKDWFGDWNEQNAAKKDSDTSAASGARDKRFRRDQEDAADLPPRSTFRSTLSQPSQMGNFKLSSRTSEREKDKDADRDRERDLRDKEGQERLRNLSDKYDRDRLSSSTGTTSLRTRERDSAPHSVGGTGRLPSQGNLGSGATRRSDGRETSRRKAGESSEDWRRGREERSDGLRREREDRERPRSRVRDSSRQRRDPSPPRRDRELDRDRDRDRDEHRRRDDRRDDHIRRDRDVERDNNDDPRRWRDDGRRDERMATRRELRDKEYRDREREKERSSRVSERDSNWDSDRPRDRDRDRWVPDERDSRPKRSNGRDRRGHSRDEDRDTKDRDDRKDSRARVEEKEPAWMDAYIPSESGAGILGGKAENGELDSIQAWKLDMKEKERKERESEALRTSGTEHTGSAKATETQATAPTEPPLDEIQLFKLIIKREGEKSKAASLRGPVSDPAIAYLGPGTDSAPSAEKLPTSTSESQPISGFVSSPLAEALAPSTAPSTKPSTPSVESPRPPGSRFFPNPSTSENAALQVQQNTQSTSSIKSPIPSQFDPPSGSRLLAFGSRTPSTATVTTVSDQSSAFPMSASNLDTPPPQPSVNRGPDMDALSADTTDCSSIATALPPGFPNLVNPTRQPVFPSDGNAQVQSEILRRQSLVSFGDRMTYGAPPDLNYSETGPTNPLGPQSNTPNSQSPSLDSGSRERAHGGSPFPQQKGSRFAKFFDGKSREQPATASAEDLSSSTHPLLPYQRQQGVGGGESYTHNGENRTMEDLFAMLQNSTQRLTQANPQTQPSGYGQTPFVQQHANMPSARQPQLAPIARNHDMLYDNRLDDRNFVPDGLVPGLRTTFPSRRESGMFQDPLDDLSAFSVQQRVPPQRAVDQMYSAPLPSMYPNQANVPRNPGLPMQQPFRNGNSPNPPHLHASTQQRLPPGLANLGGRPPHDPSQFLGSILSVPSPHLQGNGSGQPAYNFSNSGVGYPAGPQVRGPPGVSPNIQGTIDPGHVGSLLHANKLDLRTPTQAQLVGLNNGIGAGLRAPGGGFPQQNALPMHVPHAAMRQQPHVHQQAHPQAISHLLPQHIQASPGGGSQPAQDLMALLMHGVPRD